MARSPLVDRPDLEAPAALDDLPFKDEKKASAGMFKAARDFLAKQPKVKIRLPEDAVVIYNGYPFQIPGRKQVEVPKQIAEIIEQSQDLGRF